MNNNNDYITVEQRLSNFKKHISDSLARANIKIDLNPLESITLPLLLNNIKAESASGRGPPEMTDELLRYSGIDKSKLAKDDIERTTRYFQYFTEISLAFL